MIKSMLLLLIALVLLPFSMTGCSTAPEQSSQPKTKTAPITKATEDACKRERDAYVVIYEFKADGFSQEELTAMMDAHQEKTIDKEVRSQVKARSHEIINEVYDHPETSREEWYAGVYGRCLLDGLSGVPQSRP